MNSKQSAAGENVLAQDFHAGTLLKFAFPTILMMVFMGLYTIVDTIFISHFVNSNALASINIVCPVINITIGLGTMLATGGNAIIARNMGTGEVRKSKENFTLIFITGAVLGILISGIGLVWIDEIIRALGASDLLFRYCKDYLTVLFLFFPANIMQTLFSNLFVTAGRPGLGSALAIGGGVANIVLDYIFIVPCNLGIRGAALGTGFGYLLPAIAGLRFFFKNDGPLAFCRPKWSWYTIAESCLNGSSEMVSQLATAITTFLFNITIMRLLGENGVAAITIIIYSQFLLSTLYIGFSISVAPVIGFNYGSCNSQKQKRIFRICIQFIAASTALVFLLSFIGGPWITRLFANVGSEVYAIASAGFQIFSFSFLFCGINIFTSSMFTALSNGKISALLSFLRTFGFLTTGILLLPKFLDVTGIWLAVPLAEGITFLLSIGCLVLYHKTYSYF
jgi:putative MATE family efflux protein